MEGIKKWDAQDIEVHEIPLEDKERPHSFSVSFTGTCSSIMMKLRDQIRPPHIDVAIPNSLVCLPFSEQSCSYDLCFTTAQDAEDWMDALYKVLAQKGGKNHSEEGRISPPCRSNITVRSPGHATLIRQEAEEEKMFREQERILRNQQRENKLLARINPECAPMSRKSGVPQQVITSLADLLRERASEVSTIRRTKQGAATSFLVRTVGRNLRPPGLREGGVPGTRDMARAGQFEGGLSPQLVSPKEVQVRIF